MGPKASLSLHDVAGHMSAYARLRLGWGLGLGLGWAWGWPGVFFNPFRPDTIPKGLGLGWRSPQRKSSKNSTSGLLLLRTCAVGTTERPMRWQLL